MFILVYFYYEGDFWLLNIMVMKCVWYMIKIGIVFMLLMVLKNYIVLFNVKKNFCDKYGFKYC